MNKPYIKKSHLIVEIVSYVLILAAIIFGIIMTCTIEGEVPTHWDMSGNVDGYGSPASMLILPIIMLFTNLLVSACIHIMPAKSWNMPCKPKPGRELIIFSDMVWMMVWMEFAIALFTLIMTIGFFKFVICMIATVALTVGIFAILIAGIVIAVKHNK